MITNHRHSGIIAYRRTLYRHTQTDGHRDIYDRTDRRGNRTDRLTFTGTPSSRGFYHGSQRLQPYYHTYQWERRSRIDRSPGRDKNGRDMLNRRRSYGRDRDNGKKSYRETSYSSDTDYGRDKNGRDIPYRDSSYGEDKDNVRRRGHEEDRGHTEGSLRVELSERPTSSPREEEFTESRIIFPELWSTHMTEGDYLQIAQWEAETKAIETETRSKASSESVKVSQCLPDRNSRKRPLATTTPITCAEGPPLPKRPAIHVNKKYMKIGQFYGPCYYWNGYY